jgi:hypothetical protein
MNDNAIRRKAVPAFRRGLTANAILERAETLPEQRYAVKEYFPRSHLAWWKTSARGMHAHNRNQKTAGACPKIRCQCLSSSAAAAWQIYDIARANEAPGRAVMILRYVFFAGLLLGIAGTAYNAQRARQH